MDTWGRAIEIPILPKEIVNKLNAALNVAMSDPEVVKRMSSQGVSFVGGTPEQADAFLQSEITRWGEVIKSAGIKAE